MTSDPITILYTHFDNQLPEIEYNKLLNLLLPDQIERNKRFVRWQDRHSHLFGRLLLKAGLEMYGFAKDCLNALQYNKYDRPYLSNDIDFNISHSGSYVICAIGKDLKLGIDIEKVQKMEFNDFKKVMTPEQWQNINKDNYPMRAFFKYWTIKESVIKADSRGLSIPLQELHVKDNQVSYDNSTWHLHQLDFDPEYCACLATNVKNVDVSYQYVDFYSEKEQRKSEAGAFFHSIT